MGILLLNERTINDLNIIKQLDTMEMKMKMKRKKTR